MRVRPHLEGLERRDAPSALKGHYRTTLGPRGRDLVAAQVRLAERTIQGEARLAIAAGGATEAAALSVLEATAVQLAGVLAPPTTGPVPQ